MTIKGFRDSHIVVHAMETLVNPIEDGTTSRIMVTLQSLTQWRDSHEELLEPSMGKSYAHEGTTIGQQQWVSCAPSIGYNSISTIKNDENKRKLIIDGCYY